MSARDVVDVEFEIVGENPEDIVASIKRALTDPCMSCKICHFFFRIEFYCEMLCSGTDNYVIF